MGEAPSKSRRASAFRVGSIHTRADGRGCRDREGRTGRARAERDATLGRDRRGSDDAEGSDGRSHLDCWRRGVLWPASVATRGDTAEPNHERPQNAVGIRGAMSGRHFSHNLEFLVSYARQSRLFSPVHRFGACAERVSWCTRECTALGIARRAAVGSPTTVVVSRYGGVVAEPSGVRQRRGGRGGPRGGARGGAAVPRGGTHQRVSPAGDPRGGMSRGRAVVAIGGDVRRRGRLGNHRHERGESRYAPAHARHPAPRGRHRGGHLRRAGVDRAFRDPRARAAGARGGHRGGHGQNQAHGFVQGAGYGRAARGRRRRAPRRRRGRGRRASRDTREGNGRRRRRRRRRDDAFGRASRGCDGRVPRESHL